MFTGIIESVGEIISLHKEGTNLRIRIQSNISAALKIDQSVSHNGACLTVVAQDANVHEVVAIDETLKKTEIGTWKIGSKVNLERAMPANGRFDGHIVQGHVDATATCVSVHAVDGSYILRFAFPAETKAVLVEKGSICMNGISLTIFDVDTSHFSVGIIPYTWEHTNISQLQSGSVVNIEFDIIGKYVQRLLAGNTTALLQ